MRNRPSRKAKGRESAMVVTSTTSAVVTCSHCEKPGHRFQNCFKRKGTMSVNTTPPTPRKESWCSLHITGRHNNSDCWSRKRDDNKSPRPRPGQQNGRHNNNRSTHANTATTPSSTTQMKAYISVTHDPSTTAAATTAATSTSFATPPCPPSPPVGIDYFIAATPINNAAQPVEFSMTAARGASSHFIDNQLLPGTELKIYHDAQLDSPKTTNVAGSHRLYGVCQGVSVVQVLDHIGSEALCAASRPDRTRARQAAFLEGISIYKRGQHANRR